MRGRRWSPSPKHWTRDGTGAVEGVYQRGQAAKPFLQRLPFAAAGPHPLPPLEKYARLEHKGESRVVGYVEASRGCLHLCTHCPIPPVYGGRFFIVPQEIVLEDIRRQVQCGGQAHHLRRSRFPERSGALAEGRPRHARGVSRR